MSQVCEVCTQPAALGTLGEAQMHWQCAGCFTRPQVLWGNPYPSETTTVADSALANGTGATITLGAKTARMVASALEEWVILMSEHLDQLREDEDHPAGWGWDDLPMILGAAQIIREAELALGLSHPIQDR